MTPRHSKAYEEYIRRNQAAARRRYRLGGFATLIAAVALVVLLVQGSVFVLKEIEVTGNSAKNVSEIAGLSGLQLGMNIFNVDKQAIERNFLTDGYVELKNVRVELPDTVVLEISERSVCAVVNCAGVILLIDTDGYVLERRSSVPQTGNLPVVNGMDVRVSAQGRRIESGTTGQLEIMSNVLSAIYEAGAAQIVSELNISDPDNLYLISDSGIQVLLGDDEQLDIKLAWTQAVLDVLTAEGIMSGVVDVSSGNNAVYSGM